jgi:hypothetical protein
MIRDLGKKLDQDITKAQDTLKHARDMEDKYYKLLHANDSSEPQLIWNLEFTVPNVAAWPKVYTKNPSYIEKNRKEVMPTLVENIAVAKALIPLIRARLLLTISP